MHHLVKATEDAVAQGNWYAALTLALTLPDICGRLENPNQSSRLRFTAWYDKHILSKYQSRVGPDRELHTFLCATDCYALRCAFLHQGEFEIEDQRAREVLLKFHFTVPVLTVHIHCNQINNALQLQVDQFCSDICAGVIQWLRSMESDPAIPRRMSNLGQISVNTPGILF